MLTSEMLLRTIKVFILDDIYVDKDSPSHTENIQQMLKHSVTFQNVEAAESAPGTLQIIVRIDNLLMRTYRAPLT